MPPSSIIQHATLLQIAAFSSEVDAQETFPEKAFALLADAGLLEVVLPGRPLDFNVPHTAQLLHLLKQIGSADLSVGRIYEGHLNALYLIHLFGSEDQKNEWYHDAITHKKIFGVWNTQADHGINIHAAGDGRYILEGSKTFCSGAGWIGRPLITGELYREVKKGWQMCIIPTEKVKPVVQDATFWQPMGMKGSVSYRMDFTGIEITEKELIGVPGNYYFQPHFSGGAIRFAAVHLGGAEAMVNATVDYLRALNRTDDPFQQARVAEMACLITSGQQWLDHAGNHADVWTANGSAHERMVAYANMTRTAIEEICTRIMQLAGKCVGARGLMRPSPIERIHRDLTFYLRQPAPDASLTAIGKYVLHQKAGAHELWRG